MPRKVPLSPLEEINDINLTPLMDLTFILLITFIITFPLMEQGVPIDLPSGQAESITPEDEPMLVSVDAQGALFVGYDKTPVAETALLSELRAVGLARPETLVVVRGDEAIHHGRVMDVMMMVREAGLTKVSLAIRAEAGGS